ncbi:MAG: Gfo/Idh/MocA family oxidoreductase [Phycisphaerae bacterium]|nr:Gfo/Idh/MocA family oxidoreductase [Phycisphaerae bacterium]
MPTPKRYAIVGTGGRADMFFRATSGAFAESQLAALCDINQTRMDHYNGKLTAAGKKAVPTYKAADFDRMVREVKPDAVIVCCRDCDHDTYIVRAMELGCDVVTEKPMTTDEVKCKAILDAIARTGRKCTVTFNARYSPGETKVKELLAGGAIGKVLSVNYEHLLDIRHGADYFRRWHRDKANSGGLMVHKCTHCFDLVNWWADAAPKTIAAYGCTQFYGPRHGEHGLRCKTCRLTKTCKFYLDLSSTAGMRDLYLNAEKEDGYFRDQCVFGEGITTEDSVAVIVHYDNGTILSYSLNAFAPYEGNRIAFNGSEGRLELTETANTSWLVTTPEGAKAPMHKPAGAKIEIFPHHSPAYEVEIPKVEGGHGGADSLIVRDLFGPPKTSDPLGHQADHFDGARSILIGIAANRSMEWGRPVTIDELVRLPAKVRR